MTGLPDRFFVKEKDPNFVYRWCNEKDRVMFERQFQGYEVVTGPAELPPLLGGQSSENPTGGTVRRRGDLILMRIPRDAFEEKIRKPIREARERQEASVDTMIYEANEAAKRQLRTAGYDGQQLRARMVFNDQEPGPGISEQNRK